MALSINRDDLPHLPQGVDGQATVSLRHVTLEEYNAGEATMFATYTPKDDPEVMEAVERYTNLLPGNH